jgi:hypothetical protein
MSALGRLGWRVQYRCNGITPTHQQWWFALRFNTISVRVEAQF